MLLILDWYLWIPLYASACYVNLLKFCKPNSPRIRKVAKFGLCLGVFLFIKVWAEDLIHGICGIWCMDMRERVVRERFGSGLVVSSMFLVKNNSRYGMLVSQLSTFNFVSFVAQNVFMWQVCPFWLALPMASASSSLHFNIIKCDIDHSRYVGEIVKGSFIYICSSFISLRFTHLPLYYGVRIDFVLKPETFLK